MDSELKNLRLNINQIATLTGLHRQTVSSRLTSVQPAPGSNPKLKLYSALDILKELLSATTANEPVDVDKMQPTDRKAWFQSERERLKFQQETGELIPASEVVREFSSMAKAVVQALETLPDILERDCALNAAAVVPGHRYMKAGVMLGDFFSQGVAQLNLFDEFKPQANSEALMRVVDGLNQSGKGKVWFAGQGILKAWEMKREMLSPAYTTRFTDLPVVR